MKVVSTLAVLAGLTAAVPAVAAPVTIDFEDQTSFSSVNIAANPYGISATAPLQALANDGMGTGDHGEYFSNAPGSVVVFATDSLTGEHSAINSTVGFTNEVSFLYSSNAAGSVSVTDGVGGVLGTFNFVANSTDEHNPFNTWALATITFNGLAHSIDFTGSLVDGISVAGFDNVTLQPVPLPAGLLLLPSGLAALGLVQRRRRQA